MPGFLQDFLHADFTTLSRKDSPRVYLAAFGKHPGWNDHIEDIGLDSAALIAAKRYLYLQGLSGQIDANAWEKLDESVRLEGFDHWLLWHRPGEFLLGRLWSSSDGKGRTRYPMVVLAHAVGLPLGEALGSMMSVLSNVSERCRQTTSAHDVHAIVSAGLQTLRQTVAVNTDSGGAPPALLVGPSASETDWLRIFHVVVNQLPAFAPGTVDAKTEASAKGRHLRLPAISGTAEQNLTFWTAFFLTQLEWSVPTLLLLPADLSWVDAVVGEPAGPDFFCLRANRKGLPPVQDVPYQTTDALRAAVASLYDGPLGATLPARSLFSRKPTAENVQGVLTRREALWSAASGGLLKKFRGFLGA